MMTVERRKSNMAKTKMVISLGLVLLLGIFFHVLFVFADIQDSPHKAAIDFAQAYFKFDQKGMEARLCDDSKVVDDVDVVGAYVYQAAQDAKARGYSLGCYVKNKLYHVKTETFDESHDKAKVHLTAERKSGLRTFFSKEDIHPVDLTFDLVKVDGCWKVCGTSIPLDS